MVIKTKVLDLTSATLRLQKRDVKEKDNHLEANRI